MNNIFRLPDYESFTCEFYCIKFNEHILAEKTLLDYTNFFSPNNCKKNDKRILKTNMIEEASLAFR